MIHKSEIEIVENYKYFGVVLFYNGDLKHIAYHLYQKGLKAIFIRLKRDLILPGRNLFHQTDLSDNQE